MWRMALTARTPLVRVLLLQLLVVLLLAAHPLLAALSHRETVSEDDSSAAFPVLVSQMYEPSNSVSSGTKLAPIELPSRQQLHALVTDSPTILLSRTHRRNSASLFALDAHDSGLARIDGRGRTDRPSGISITRGLPITSRKVAREFHYGNLPMDDAAITFEPNLLNMGTRATCMPVLWFAEIINNARFGVRLDEVEFTREGFELLSNVQGIVLEPTGRLTVQFLFTPSHPEPRFEAFMRVFTSSGQFALSISANVVVHKLGITGIRAIVPVAMEFDASLILRNPFDEMIRVLDVFSRDPIGTFSMPNGATATAPSSRAQVGGPRTGAWDIPPGEERRIVDYTFYSKTEGVFFTYIRVVTTAEEAVAIPVVVEVVPEGMHFEPSHVDLGILTQHDALREVYVHLHNAGTAPVKIYSVHVEETTTTNMGITVKMNGPIVIPPRTRIRQALKIEATARVNTDNNNGTKCFATLTLKTNQTANAFRGQMKLAGTQVSGALEYRFNETLVGVVSSLFEALGGEREDEESGSDDNSSSSSKSSRRLMTTSAFVNGSVLGVEAGATVHRSLRLQNLYNVSLELEHVWVPVEPSGGAPVVEVDHFEPGVAKGGEYWPGEIRLRVTPPSLNEANLLVLRVYPVHIETNLMKHRVNVHVFYGFLQVNSRTGLSNYSSAGYLPVVKAKGTKPLKVCNSVSDLNKNSSSSSQPTAAIAGGKNDTRAKLCRSFVLDLGKVSTKGIRTKLLNLTNINPIPVGIKIASLIKSELFDLAITSDITESRQVPLEIAAIGKQYAEIARNSSQIDIFSSLRVKSSSPKPKKKNFRLHEDIVIPPGHDFVLRLGLQVVNELGEFTKYLLTLETPFEFIHVYAHFESVEGVIRPVATKAEVPPMFAGSTGFIDIHYENTFNHSVPIRGVTFPSSSVQVVTTNQYIAAGSTHSGVSILISPAYSKVCSNSKYLADCLFPDIDESTLSSPLSDYGEDVTEQDIAQFDRRQVYWSTVESSGAQNHTLKATVQLHTGIMITDAIEITAPLIRPSVTNMNLSEKTVVGDMGLTKVMEYKRMTVSVFNPSGVAIDVELAVRDRDRALFYKCSPGVDDETACLDEWEAAVRQGAGNAKQSVAPFFVASKVVRVPWDGVTELGPVYFFPSHVFEINTTIFVRNNLTHLEPVALFARSGKGELQVHVHTEDQDQQKEEDAGVSKVSDELFKFDSNNNNSNNKNDNLVVRFKLPNLNGPSRAPAKPLQQVIELRNVGTCNALVESVRLMYDLAAPLLKRTFAVTFDGVPPEQQRALEEDGPLLIYPGSSMSLRITYAPNCFIARIEQELVVETDNVMIRVPLIAEVRPSAAFDCLRARVPANVLMLLFALWKLAVLVAVVISFYSVYSGLSGVLSLYDRETSIRVANHFVSKERAHGISALEPLSGLEYQQHDNCESTYRYLDELKANSYSPDIRVQTPAVAKLLLERQKKSSLAPNKQDVDNKIALEEEIALEALLAVPAAKIAHTLQLEQRKEKEAGKKTEVRTLSIAAVIAESPIQANPAAATTTVPKPKPPIERPPPVKPAVQAKFKPTSVTATAPELKPSTRRPPPVKLAPAPAPAPAPAELKSDSAAATKPKPLVERPPPVKATSPMPKPPVKAVSETNASQKAIIKPKAAARSKNASTTPRKESSRAVVLVMKPNSASKSTATKERAAESVIVGDNTVRVEKKVVPRAKKVVRPTRGKRGDQERGAATSPFQVGLSVVIENNRFIVDNQEPVDALASSMDSTSTTVSFDSEDLKLSPAKKKPSELESAAGNTDFFLSMTFEAPFSSFGAIGKRRNPVSPKPQRGEFVSNGDNQEEDAVLMERFGLRSLEPKANTVTVSNGLRPSEARDSSLDSIEDDWSDLYFDSIRSEIGRLVSSSGNNNSGSKEDNSNRSSGMLENGFHSLHTRQPPSNSLVYSLQRPMERAPAVPRMASSTPPPVSTATTTTTTTTKKTPPGFTPADANPHESRAAFERLQSASPHGSAASPSTTVTTPTTATLDNATDSSSRFVFASRFALFGPHLGHSSSPFSGGGDNSGAAGGGVAIPSSNGLSRGVASTASSVCDWDTGAPLLLGAQGSELLTLGHKRGGEDGRAVFARNALASLGGVELLSPSSAATASTSSSFASTSPYSLQ